MAQRLNRKRSRGEDGASNRTPSAKKEHRTGSKRPCPPERDQSFEDLEISQLPTQDMKETDVNLRQAEIGVIEKLTLINFMCHENLELSFSPNVNFILGRNGSGKSAIMTGIVVGLGGKARSTQRGSSLKQFIRTGAQSAEVIVHLRNRGSDAYNHDDYGNTIICERLIREDGTGGYKIKSEKGKVISTKKEEIDAILDHCLIQIDNPVSLLNQDTSRNFLHSSKPSAKYKLFMRATHLEEIAIDYEQSKEEQKIMEEAVECIKSNLPILKAEAKKLEEQVDSFRRFSEMESKIEQLENELKWSIVVEMESIIPPIEVDIEKEKSRIARNVDKIRCSKANVDQAKEEIKTIQKGFNDLTQEARQVKEERVSTAGEKREKQQKVQESQAQLAHLSKRIAAERSEKEALECEMQKCILASQRDTAGERETKLKELRDHEEQLRRLEAEIATAENDRGQFNAALGRSQERTNAHRSKKTGVEARIHTCEDQLRLLQSSRNDTLAAFGKDMRTLVTELHKNRHRFRHLPKGPIGSLISLKDYKWSTAIEQVVKRGTLKAFVLDNHQDAAVYKDIAKRVVRGDFIPDAITSSFIGKVYDVSQRLAQSNYPTVYEVLNVDDPDVMNVLIDQCHVESILLIENRVVAARVISRESSVYVRQAYTIEGDQILKSGHYSNKENRYGIIKASVDDLIRDEEEKLFHLKSDYDRMDQECRELVNEEDINKRQVTALGEKIRRKLEAKRKLTMSLMKLRNTQEEEEPEEDTATYESEIAELEEKITKLVAERDGQARVIKQRKVEFETVMKRIKECDTKVEQVARKLEDLKVCLNSGDQKKKKQEHFLQLYESRVAAIQTNISSLEDELNKQREEISEALKAAEESCKRMNIKRSRKSITSEIRILRKHIEEDQPSLEEQEAVVNKYTSAMDNYKANKMTVKHSIEALKRLEESLSLRINKYQKLQERVATRTSYLFSFFLQQRDYDGKIKFDHNKEHLIIEVKVDSHTKQSQSTSNTKALSGGERSFSTVCFIMALWDAINAPFRCLDEFDVFMDMLNRRISMRMMMELAEEKYTRQFIFFTPQDMSSMGVFSNKMIKVQRLREPIRGGQTTLD